MVVHLYAICWNEIRVLEFFLRHYAGWVDRFYLFDDGSDDGTVEILRTKAGIEVRPFPHRCARSYEMSQKALHDECWKESRGAADWVIVTDVDEHLYHPRLGEYLNYCADRGVTYIPALGVDMLTEKFPQSGEHLCHTRTRGVPDAWYSKLRLFNPDALDEVNFSVGGHTAYPSGSLVLPEKDEVLLLHYKHLGLDYVLPRHAALRARLKEEDLRNGWGSHYFRTPEEYKLELEAAKPKLIDISDSQYVPANDHREPRWWRPEQSHLAGA